MVGLLKVRDDMTDGQLQRNEDSGWYEEPAGSMARPASAEEVARDIQG
ncbi:hypothetical protein Poly30_03470 [Planctomycetes bacterium Poly30]|uniref:Uncharacterized protein n=1 Tax=Saltatorellus ferox TaxID=2528018 RepID=A0A518EL92_9BACT|nr:hypothetical protein Poly30_03470 [Planctomycetes bacterium Poly30]